MAKHARAESALSARSARSARLRVPQDHGATLVQPSVSHATAMIESNQQLWQAFPQALQAIRSKARQELTVLALEYSNRYLESPLSLPSEPQGVVMSGHQPTLFHPGVWFKNFVLGAVAKRSAAVAINLVVDNDLCDNLRIRAPQVVAGSGGRSLYVPIDQAAAAIPFESRQVIDREQFAGFGKRLAEAAAPIVGRPLIKRLWPEVMAVSAGMLMPASLAAGRHRLEAQAGLHHLELPVSLLCASESFAAFVTRIVESPSSFREIYNRSLAEYRSANRIRSRSHPVPQLEQLESHCELPFWVWSAEDPRRRRLFVKLRDREVELSDRCGWSATLSRGDLLGELQELNRIDSPVCLRPRALATTMFSRLLASDLFIHGIGGAKYDELGDVIAERFFKVTAPQYLTVSATMKLPAEAAYGTIVSRASIRALEQRLRELRFHPEREFPGDIRESKKRALVLENPTSNRKQWHRAIEAINEELFRELAAETKAIQRQLKEAKEALPEAELRDSREFSFALFPSSLIDQLKALAR